MKAHIKESVRTLFPSNFPEEVIVKSKRGFEILSSHEFLELSLTGRSDTAAVSDGQLHDDV